MHLSSIQPVTGNMDRKGEIRIMLILASVAIVGFVVWGLPVLLQPAAAGEAVAPDPAEYKGAVVQVYGADVWGVRGKFAIHTWIATKAPNADSYTLYHVLGWRKYRRQSVVSIGEGVPNQNWFGSEPILLQEYYGDAAAKMVDRIDDAAREYPYADTYRMWPGPNSNSFIAWIGLKVPELNLALPAKAIGKNWMENNFNDRPGNRIASCCGEASFATDSSDN